jgi:hypothetical protein
MLPNSDVEADVALSRCAPSGPRSLRQALSRRNIIRRPASDASCTSVRAWSLLGRKPYSPEWVAPFPSEAPSSENGAREGERSGDSRRVANESGNLARYHGRRASRSASPRCRCNIEHVGQRGVACVVAAATESRRVEAMPRCDNLGARHS